MLKDKRLERLVKACLYFKNKPYHTKIFGQLKKKYLSTLFIAQLRN